MNTWNRFRRLTKEMTRALLLLLTATACQARPTSPAPGYAAYVPSLKSALPQLSELAKEWDSEAYLADASVDFGFQDWSIHAGYQSPSRTDESLLLLLGPDGNVKRELVTHTRGVRQQEPIRDSDWIIDSAEAVRRMVAAKPSAQPLGARPPRCSEVELERFDLLPDNPVVWSLSLWDCSSLDFDYRYMDPITGAMLDLDRTLDATEEALLTPLP